MTTWTDDAGDIIATTDFTDSCPDCDAPIAVRDGVSDPHDCPMPEQLRGRVSAAAAEATRWTCEQAGHPAWVQGGACICGTWAPRIEEGAVVIACPQEDRPALEEIDR